MADVNGSLRVDFRGLRWSFSRRHKVELGRHCSNSKSTSVLSFLRVWGSSNSEVAPQKDGEDFSQDEVTDKYSNLWRTARVDG